MDICINHRIESQYHRDALQVALIAYNFLIFGFNQINRSPYANNWYNNVDPKCRCRGYCAWKLHKLLRLVHLEVLVVGWNCSTSTIVCRSPLPDIASTRSGAGHQLYRLSAAGLGWLTPILALLGHFSIADIYQSLPWQCLRPDARLVFIRY